VFLIFITDLKINTDAKSVVEEEREKKKREGRPLRHVAADHEESGGRKEERICIRSILTII